ncbi:M61 family metallopeptidase [Thalassotalea ganghwensis]
MTIKYAITADDIRRHLFDVSITFDTKPGVCYHLRLPSWLPGSYMVRDFAKHIHRLAAVSENSAALELSKLDKQRWHVTATDKKITLTYQVFAFDLSVRTAYLDSQRGFFNGSSTFIEIEELSEQPCTLDIIKSDLMDNWRVATGLPRAKGTDLYQFGHYKAENYQHLIDCPVALGDFDAIEFTVNEIPHYLVFTRKHYGDQQRLIDDLTKICQHHIALFSDAPFEEYWFITHLLGEGFGGLEHKNSTVLQASRFDLPNPNNQQETSEGYQTFLSLCSHEYFHAWNVCRIKPAEFIPYDLAKEVYTEQLWAYEGITSYYDDLSLYRAGLIDFDKYLATLAKTATRVNRGDGQLQQNVIDSSFYAWTKFYQQGPDAVNHIVSYYTKGSLIALWLDLSIRKSSQGKHSLDDLMRLLWQKFGKNNIGTKLDDYFSLVEQLANPAVKTQLKHLLFETDRINLEPILADFGIEQSLTKFAAINSLDTSECKDYVPYIGAQFSESDHGLKLSVVLANSPAQQAGLAVNDVIVALDNVKAKTKTIQAIAAHLPKEAEVTCHFFRDDQLMTTSVKFADSPRLAISYRVADENKAANWQKVFG